uniref:Uncharacterized protein n=1 Tax=Romanomermis culicivorax TaxID=13658 RepID=A0A915HYR6_ROMCU
MEVGADSNDDDGDSATPETQLTNLLEAFEDCGQLSMNLIQEKQNLENDNEILRRQIDELRTKLDNERKLNENLKDDYDRLNQLSESTRKSYQERDEQLKLFTEEMSAKNQEISRLKEQLEGEKRRAFDRIKKIETEFDGKFKRMKNDLNRSNDRLKLMSAQAQESRSRASELEMKLSLCDKLKHEQSPSRSPKIEPWFKPYNKESHSTDYEKLLNEERSRYNQKIKDFDAEVALLNEDLTRVTDLLEAAEQREKEFKRLSKIENEALCDQQSNSLEDRVRKLTEEFKALFDREESLKNESEKLRKENEELQNKVLSEKKASKHWHKKYELEFTNNKKFYHKIKQMKQQVKETVEATRQDLTFLRSKLEEVKKTIFNDVPKYFGDLNSLVEKVNVSLRKMHENHAFMVTRLTTLTQKVVNLQQEQENISKIVVHDMVEKDTNTDSIGFVDGTTNTALLEEQLKDLDPESNIQSLSDQCVGSILYELHYLRLETCKCQRLVLESQNALAEQKEENEALELKMCSMKEEMERNFMAKIKTLLAGH